MKRNAWFVVFLVIACLFSFTAVGAEEKKPEAKQEQAAKLGPKDLAPFSKEVAMFSQLVSFGEANKDALVMVGAVRLMDSFPFQGIAKPGKEGKSGVLYERVALLNQAKEFASGDTEVLAVIAKLQDVPEKTDVRSRHGGNHGGNHGHHNWGNHGGYHGGGYYYPVRYGCVWYQVCGRHGCSWVCR
jgi:hypothetical protein